MCHIVLQSNRNTGCIAVELLIQYPSGTMIVRPHREASRLGGEPSYNNRGSVYLCDERWCQTYKGLWQLWQSLTARITMTAYRLQLYSKLPRATSKENTKTPIYWQFVRQIQCRPVTYIHILFLWFDICTAMLYICVFIYKSYVGWYVINRSNKNSHFIGTDVGIKPKVDVVELISTVF